MRGLVLVGVAAAALAFAGPADATLVSFSGGIVVRWQSNPDTCAAFGLCGRSGALSWRPSVTGQLQGVGGIALDLFGGSAKAWSTRTSGGSSAVCVDSPEGPNDLTVEPVGGHGVVVAIGDPWGLGFGRCAGPLGADFSAALPRSAPVASAALRRGTRVDMSGSKPFSAGPFSGEVESTLVLQTRRERKAGEFSSGITIRLKRGPLERLGTLSLTYSVDRLSGSTGVSYSGVPGACEAFDTCGLQGDLSVAAEAPGGALVVHAVRPLARGPETMAAALRALHEGRSTVDAQSLLGQGTGTAEGGLTLPITEQAGFGGDQPCSETSHIHVDGLGVNRTTGGLRVSLAPTGNSFPDQLRTRCPGPAGADLSHGGAIAAATLPFATMGDRAPPLVLHAPAFSAASYQGVGHGEITVTLRLLRAVVGTHVVRRQREPF